MNLRLGVLALLAMVAANSALLWRDILPRWTAGDPPRRSVQQLAIGDEQKTQTAIYAEDGVIIGHSWALSLRNPETLSVRSYTQFERMRVGRFTLPARLTVVTGFYFNNANELDSLDVNVYGLGVPMLLKGDFVPPDSFPCQWQLDTMRGTFVLEGASTKALCDSTRPFDLLPDLHVGKSWRVELFNPLSAAVPGMGDSGWRTEPLYVRVVADERIRHRGVEVDTFRVEADRIRAWVARDGRVLRQEVYFPLLGQLTLLDEPYDDLMHRAAMQKMTHADPPIADERRTLE